MNESVEVNVNSKSSGGVVAMISGIVVMIAAIALFCIAFQTAGTDAFAYWLWALALGFVGAFVWSWGVKQQRLGAEGSEREAARRRPANDSNFHGDDVTKH
ncbi:hypothetical protein ABWH74_001556 [Burkholderia vietnamiensis]|uniref:hypothetical protein n=1 Tax=Burkholderia vietnamiensis TaxID=60552 RepID=UPI00158CB74F|nr:hypothetical protein [Burkholderia vietnamiensis]MBR8009393.1 hypothetical protein [Burkholderia vietnamiensis]MBR8190423.1 hypothetical protein [Burkholderia vietnamiensis]MCA8269155.1 hypothetical protein [Burkholderia vietnamiensis]MDN8070820.1 hypothetical protein [Burkholderia vietnamiensis]MDN8073703.1 hypothetical protein [Burkholderia vietnamiensis]